MRQQNDEREIREAIGQARPTLVDHAIAALESQRRIAKRDHDAGRVACWVGGFAQLTTITSEAITTRIIHRWRDMVGRTVDLRA